MTMRARDLGVIPEDTAALGQQLFGPTNRYRVIGDHLADILADAQFADLYSQRGRAAIAPSLLAMIVVFQFMESVPDRAAAELVTARLDWKYALHLPLGYRGFDYSVLCYFRRRVVEHAETGRIFEAILARIAALGLLGKGGKVRTDALAVVGAVRELSALETVTETLRVALVGAAKAAPSWLEQVVPHRLWQTYVEGRPNYRLSKAARAAALETAGADAGWLLAAVSAAPKGVQRVGGMATLQRVYRQRFVECGERVVAKAATPPATELVVTPHDLGVRAGEKRGHRWQGTKVHVTETVGADGERFIVDVVTGNASGRDTLSLATVRANLAARGLTPQVHYVDAGYISAGQLAASAAAGVALVGPPLRDTSPHCFKLPDFTLDYAAKQAVCPNGNVSAKWVNRTERDGSRAFGITFRATDCAHCPLHADCTSAKGGRTLHINEHYPLLAERRLAMANPAFRAELAHRAGIEATLSELVRVHGLRRHRYRGDAQRHHENLLKAAACNLKRLTRVLAGQIASKPLPKA